MDLDTFITTLYVIVDDWFREKAMESLLKRSGPEPEMSDSEVLSVALAGQWRKGVPWDSERSLVRYMQKHGRKWFPKMLAKTAFNQRVRNLWAVLLQLQQDLAQNLKAENTLYEIVDTVPLPAATVNQSKAERGHWLQTAEMGYGGNQGKLYWGHQALMSIQPSGMVSGWLLASASSDDRCLLQGFLSQRAGQAEFIAPEPWRPHRRLFAPAFMGAFLACGKAAARYLADKGFNGFRWQRHWASLYQVDVLTAPSKKTKGHLWPRSWGRWLKALRQPIETVFALMSEVFSLKRLQAHSLWGLYTRLALVTTAHNLGILLNQQLGRALLSHATLIC